MQQTLKQITGWKCFLIRKRSQLIVISEAVKLFRNPFQAVSEMKMLRDLENKVNGSNTIYKFIKSGKRLFWTAEYCGFPSENFKFLIRSEFHSNWQTGIGRFGGLPVMKTLIWGITNRCPHSCSHCYEWDNIEQRDRLDLNALKKILNIFKASGLRHIQFSGGEPMVRFNDLAELTREASTSMDCWLLTSGFGISPEKASILKKAGLTGAHISLDHWDPQINNNFRNNVKSYAMVTEAVRNCLDAGIIVSLSLCATREFTSEENLIKYASLGKTLGVQFIRILEPRAAGKFARQNVLLDQKQVELISEFAIRMNTDARYRDFPIINFLGYHQRKMPCFGAGNRFLYADPNGDVHACPFCRGKMGNLLEEPFEQIIKKVKGVGCHEFKNQSSATVN